jgi:hypothetical protein
VSHALRDVRHNEGPTNTVLMNSPSGEAEIEIEN